MKSSPTISWLQYIGNYLIGLSFAIPLGLYLKSASTFAMFRAKSDIIDVFPTVIIALYSCSRLFGAAYSFLKKTDYTTASINTDRKTTSSFRRDLWTVRIILIFSWLLVGFTGFFIVFKVIRLDALVIVMMISICFLSGGSSVGKPLIFGCIAATASQNPKSKYYLQAMISGQMSSGIITSIGALLSAVGVIESSVDLTCVIGTYFLIGSFIVFLGWCFFEYKCKYQMIPNENGIVTSDAFVVSVDKECENDSLVVCREDEPGLTPLSAIVKYKYYIISLFLLAVQSSIVYPTMTVVVQSCNNFKYLLPVLFIIGDISDIIGTISAVFLVDRKSEGRNSKANLTSKYPIATVSIKFILSFFFFLTTNTVYRDSYGEPLTSPWVPLLIKNDAALMIGTCINTFLFGFLYSYLMINSSSKSGKSNAKIVSALMMLSMTIGLSTGSLLAFAVKPLYCACDPY